MNSFFEFFYSDFVFLRPFIYFVGTKKSVFILFVVLIFNFYFAQNNAVKVKVKDENTGENIKDVSFINNNEVNFSNEEGALFLSSGYYEIQNINYEGRHLQINNDTLLYLTPIINEIEEVVFTPNKVNKLIRSISENIKVNYPVNPFNSIGIVRYQLRNDDDLVLFQDVGFKGYHSGVKENELSPKNRFEILSTVFSEDFGSERFRFITYTCNELFNTFSKAVNINSNNKKFSVEYENENTKVNFYGVRREEGIIVDGYVIFNTKDYGLIELKYNIKNKNYKRKIHNAILSKTESSLNVFLIKEKISIYLL